MKPESNQFTIRNLQENLALILFMFVLLIISIVQDVTAQELTPANDPYFPGKHKFNAGLITTYRGSGVPAPVLIGEVNYGITNRFTLGVVGGTTGTASLVALKMVAALYQQEAFRLLYRMTIIYYPERNGTYLFDKSNKQVMPWMLSMGLVDAEWRLSSGIRLSAGMGLLETHCVDGMMNLLTGTTPTGEEAEDELPFELFNTVQTSISIPLSKKLTLRPEAIFILQGLQPVTGEHKVRPVNLYLNLVYTF